MRKTLKSLRKTFQKYSEKSYTTTIQKRAVKGTQKCYTLSCSVASDTNFQSSTDSPQPQLHMMEALKIKNLKFLLFLKPRHY